MNSRTDADLEELYRPIARGLDGFALDHGLIANRFRHSAPTWDLLFRHPIAGQGKISVLPAPAKAYFLIGYWWIDELPERRRMSKQTELRPVGIDVDALKQALELLLREIMAWDVASLTNVQPFPESTPDNVIANGNTLAAQLPLPRLES